MKADAFFVGAQGLKCPGNVFVRTPSLTVRSQLKLPAASYGECAHSSIQLCFPSPIRLKVLELVGIEHQPSLHGLETQGAMLMPERLEPLGDPL
jgi:hypothetical protein